MALLNIGLYGLALKSNFQVGNELLMDEVIVNTSSMKSVRAAVQEYDADIPLGVSVLERRVGINVDVAASTSMDETAVISEDGDDKE